MQIRRALVSVSDKSYLEVLGAYLIAGGVELFATPRSAAYLQQHKLAVNPLPTQGPSGRLSGGKITTIDPIIHAGILVGDDPNELAALQRVGGVPFDLVVVNLRPLGEPSGLPALLEQLDLGGPALLRSAAANCRRVAVLADPADYAKFIPAFNNKKLDDEKRIDLALKAMSVLARYETAVGARVAALSSPDSPFPEAISLLFDQVSEVAAENAHQRAALYSPHDPPRGALPQSILYGSGDDPSPSFRQTHDASIAMQLVGELEGSSCTFVARQRPIATSTAPTPDQAFRAIEQAIRPEIDGVVGVNFHVPPSLAQTMLASAVKCVVAPSFDPDALDVLRGRADLILIATKGMLPAGYAEQQLTQVTRGVLVQERDTTSSGEVANGKVVSVLQPRPHELRALDFAWKVAKYARSEAVVIAREEADGTVRTLGVGAGGVSRREALDLALAQAGPSAQGVVMASDGNFTSRDDLERAMKHGVLAMVQPGSDDDAALVAPYGHVLALVNTGVSHHRN